MHVWMHITRTNTRDFCRCSWLAWYPPSILQPASKKLGITYALLAHYVWGTARSTLSNVNCLQPMQDSCSARCHEAGESSLMNPVLCCGTDTIRYWMLLLLVVAIAPCCYCCRCSSWYVVNHHQLVCAVHDLLFDMAAYYRCPHHGLYLHIAIG